MRPPICAVCSERFSPQEGGLVSFTLTKEEIEFNKVFETKGYSGHPKGLDWFCDKHLSVAKSLTHLTLGEALNKIRISNNS